MKKERNRLIQKGAKFAPRKACKTLRKDDALLAILNGRSGLALGSQFRGWRAPGSKPDSPEGPAVAKCPPAAVVWKLGGVISSDADLVILPRFKMTKSVPIALVFFQNWTLM
ncbi:hypothetical protein AVEN_233067-1 [Araneus ventricosus]|uniref:Uncharacterized protein n=1 Tax=Araneus ventricosus TaxID=182803 RepID=A0A4Y2QBS5_ARAVE|nr:hypothetical protein AVEN_233067-1 [Araneus ventricosus]